jgi:guanylate kinase
VVRRLLELRPDLVLSVSCTTRPPRPGEVDGRDYRFVGREEFDRLIDEGAFLEWARLYGQHRSGTPREPVRRELAAGRDVLLEIDVQGAAEVRRRVPDAVLVFLAPPSVDELGRRLRLRRTESEEDAARRLAAAASELEQADRFDHVVVNDEVDRAAAEVAGIIDAVGGGRFPAGRRPIPPS